MDAAVCDDADHFFTNADDNYRTGTNDPGSPDYRCTLRRYFDHRSFDEREWKQHYARGARYVACSR